MAEIIMRNWNLRAFRVRVNLPSPIRQVQVPIWHVITPIQGLPNPIRQVVPLISYFRSYPAHGSHLHPPSLSFPSISLSSSQNTMSSHPSLSLHAMIISSHWVQHTPSTAYTEYSMHRVQHTPRPAYTEYSIHPRLFVFHSFSWLQVDPGMPLQLTACLHIRSTAMKAQSSSYLTDE